MIRVGLLLVLAAVIVLAAMYITYRTLERREVRKAETERLEWRRRMVEDERLHDEVYGDPFEDQDEIDEALAADIRVDLRDDESER